ncbi:MAG: hypothetical protein UX91_C0001G0099 [Candidatus Amesbacteria bacterium GW2011_GWB1_47_19]|nr:MAG: hypothetical protein UW51_C0001G0099 [Candidatus Amesbacteria bacterium GW2011_GWA1_44_24]KKU32111.1 MAG: hypothetical protein UX46_C0001G0098 [Candidatus Amesbacteria bacterium GW2011_GWC1_46_24]KKU67795.1 MAG: hypothetical protein UX91_C0001G0099 [Candidatus Amesbacteria bacterium GW2011_GWB1_47_19]OGD06019.1 MAG: hypothetical protein A2379_02915 [Candidatus Amesbacteria bacterium RIFOXYB1_FULL_47_13]HBC72392.1 hypothetical protein [Candidatus Amesbacteria bacterium]
MQSRYPLIIIVSLFLLFFAFLLLPRVTDLLPSDTGKTPVMCGGIANIQCPLGYTCQMEGDYPDASGRCVSVVNKPKIKLPWFPRKNTRVCPATSWINCMPGPGAKNPQCTQEFLQWAQTNCPDFEGAAY